jgi:hypothetical protein
MKPGFVSKILIGVAIVLLAGAPAFAHRLDEYLQGTLISVEKDRVDAQITLTPGVAVFPMLIAEVDANADGEISSSEQLAYAGRFLHDISLSIDGHPLSPHLASIAFPAIAEMKEGRGEIQIELIADLPRGGHDRKLVFENRHESRIAAYQVNSLVPRDPDIRIVRQNRSYSQAFYEVEFTQADVRSNALSLGGLPAAPKPLGTVALLLAAWGTLLWRRRV